MQSRDGVEGVSDPNDIMPPVAENLGPMRLTLDQYLFTESQPLEFFVGVRRYKIQQERRCDNRHLNRQQLIVATKESRNVMSGNRVNFRAVEDSIGAQFAGIVIPVGQKFHGVSRLVHYDEPVLSVAERPIDEAHAVSLFIRFPLEFKHGHSP